MQRPSPSRPIPVVFFQTPAGTEPVREWLLELAAEERRTLGEDIKTLQFRWPLGLPLVRPLGKGLWEVRSTLKNRIARVIFTLSEGKILLLHGFIKKTQATPQSDLDLALDRLRASQRN